MMKKSTLAALFGAVILLNLILWFRTISLQQNIENLQHNMSNQFSHLSSEVRGIGQNVSDTLERQASLFDGVDWSLGAVDTNNLTMPLTVSVVPKEADSESTATLTANGASVPMTRDGVHFTCVLPVGLFEPLAIYVTLDSAGTQRTQQLLDGLLPFEDRLPMLYAQNAGGSSFEHYASKFKLDGPIDINVKVPESTALTSLKIVTTDNGTVIKEQALTPAFEPPAWSQMVDYTLELTLESNHTYETAVIATDSFGLSYRAIVDRQVVGASSRTPDFGEMGQWGETVILDKNGRVLYDLTAQYR